MKAARFGLTLGVHPTSRGLAWIAFEGPFAPYDWGSFQPRKEKSTRCLQKLARLLDQLPVETLVLEAFDPQMSSRADRISRLCRGIVTLAQDRRVDVAIYSRADVQRCFAGTGARTRQEIAEAVIRHVDAFRHRLPKRRRPWDSEDPKMALFSAAALVLTHRRTDGMRILQEFSM